MKTIVYIIGKHIENGSWFCHEKGEAERLAKFLSDNGVYAIALTKDEWNNIRFRLIA